MKLGSHNTMTYLKPKKWYLYPFQVFARCQSKNIEEQYNSGARWFDLRIAFDKRSNPEFKHGIMSYKGNVEDILDFLNTKDNIIVRILSEDGNIFFKYYCAHLENKYPNMKFTGGQNKKDWSKLYNFKNEVNYTSKDWFSSSPTVSKIWSLCPWLWSKLNNKKIKKEQVDYMIIDFI